MILGNRDSTKVGRVIGSVVTNNRVAKGMNKTNYSRSTGLCKTTVYNMENGLSQSVQNLDAILTAIGMTWQEMGKMIDEEKAKKNVS